MAKNILIFSDGTGQSGGQRPDQRLSNIYKLYRATRVNPDNNIDPDHQVAFYDAGLGTDEDASTVRSQFARWFRKLASSATGTGLGRNIVDCYEAILKVYEPGDRIYLFGFSRGAYTARCVAGVLGLCGVPTKMPDGSPLPKGGSALREIAEVAVHTVYEHGSGKDRPTFAPERKELAKRFRTKYSSGVKQANVVPYFIGVFDTVAALGARGVRRWVMLGGLVLGVAALLYGLSFPMEWILGIGRRAAFGATVAAAALIAFILIARSRRKVIFDYPSEGKNKAHWAGWSFAFYDTYLNPRVRFARHALAIDETRVDFDRVYWGQKDNNRKRDEGDPEPFVQMWFAGNHSDIGGSYSEDESRLSDIALKWMVDEVTSLPEPVLVEASKLHLFPRANGVQHCEAESTLDRYPRWWPPRLRWGWGIKVRRLKDGATLHPTVAERFALAEVGQCARSAPYRPEALRNDGRFRDLYLPPS